ncbi:MAG: hypothetical protein M1820_008179 [Bogoriella megaspora]|nr:MAG: hypothetical protein M1820_008179 [Bogoriella megaspora]
MGDLEDSLQDANLLVQPLMESSAVAKAYKILIRLDKYLEAEKQEKVAAGKELDAYDDYRFKTIVALFEFIAVYGLLPWLPSTIAQTAKAKRLKSASVPISEQESRLLLGSLVSDELNSGLAKIAVDTGKGVEPMLRDSILPIVTCAIALRSHIDSQTYAQSSSSFHTFVSSLPLVIVLPLLMSLIKIVKIPELNNSFSLELSLLPLRPHGVQHIIEFIASSLASLTASEASKQPLDNAAPEIPMSLEALQQASRLLSSVPPSLDSGIYFQSIAPQLVELLDEKAGEAMSTAAAYTIGTGILGKRSTGAPGTEGWGLFAAPIIQAINPISNAVHKQSHVQENGHTTLGPTLTSGLELELALNRLSKLILLHPNPGVSKRLLQTLIVPLWDIASSGSNPTGSSSALHQANKAWEILITYMKLYTSEGQAVALSNRLLSSESTSWKLAADFNGRLEIRKLVPNTRSSNDMLQQMSAVNRKVKLFVKLLSVSTLSSEITCAVFFNASKEWLTSRRRTFDVASAIDSSIMEEDKALRMMINANLVTEMLDTFQNDLASQPAQLLGIVDRLLAGLAESLKKARSVPSPPILSRRDLTQISASEEQLNEDSSEASGRLSEDSTIEVALATSLLQTVLQSLNGSKDEYVQLLESIKGSVEVIQRNDQKLPPSLQRSMSGVDNLLLSIIDSTRMPQNRSLQNQVDQSPHDALKDGKDRQLYANAIEAISSPMPPIRAEGLSSLDSLIRRSSLAVDIPSVAVLLTSILEEDNSKRSTILPSPRNHDPNDTEEIDDFVMLGTLRSLTQLAIHEPEIVIPLLLEVYLDPSSKHGLDARLRVAEALEGLVVDTDSSQATSHSRLMPQRTKFVGRIVEAAVTIASRRGRAQPQESVPGGDHQTQETSPTEVGGEEHTSAEDDILHRVLETWKLTPHNEEDLRLRSSALGLLSQILSHSPLADLTIDSLLNVILEIGTSVLRLEVGPEKAIVRRAAALVCLHFVRALDLTFNEGGEAGLLELKIDIDATLDVVSAVVARVVSDDEDELTRGHGEAVLEEIETWREKRRLGLSEVAGPEAAGLTNDLELKLDNGNLRGLSVDVRNRRAGQDHRKLIEEVED